MGWRPAITVILLGAICGIISLQVAAMLKSDRIYERLNSIDSQLGGAQGSFAGMTAGSYNTNKPAGHDEGDWLVWQIGAEPETLNPVTAKDVYALWICWRNIFEGLMEYDPDTLALKPKLAQSYEISKDGLTITFVLRPDVHFSDGKPVTSDDVIFTYNCIRDPNADASKWAQYYGNVDRVERVDDRTVRFVLKASYFKSLDYCSFVEIGILPKHVYQFKNAMDFNNHRSNPVGSGPYVFERWRVGQDIVLARNERYWGKKLSLKKLVFKIIVNNYAAVQALKSHQIDMMVPEPDQFSDLANDPKFSKDFQCISVWVPQVWFGYIGWNADTAFFKDRRVRLAMTHLVDREMICKELFKGFAEVPTGPFFSRGLMNDPTIKPWPCDIEKVKQLLDEAGWRETAGGIRMKDGVPFKFKFMIVSGRNFHEQLAKHLKDQCARVGIEVTVEPFEWSVFITRLLDRKFDAVTLAWFGDVVEDPYEMFHSSQIGNHGSNEAGFHNAEADRFMEQARAILDVNERVKVYHRIGKIIHEEQPLTFVYTRPSFRFIDPRFKNVVVHKIGLDLLEWYVPKNEQRYK